MGSIVFWEGHFCWGKRFNKEGAVWTEGDEQQAFQPNKHLWTLDIIPLVNLFNALSFIPSIGSLIF